MATYLIDAANVNEPLDTREVVAMAAELRALKLRLNAATATGVAATILGEIRAGLFAVAPAGWLLMPSAATLINRALYPAFTAMLVAMGAPWGVGDGVTTIGMPYMPDGYVPVHDNTKALGAATNSAGAVKLHEHNVVVQLGQIAPTGQPVIVSGTSNTIGSHPFTAQSSPHADPLQAATSPINAPASVVMRYIIRVF